MDGSQNAGLLTETGSLTYWNIVTNCTMGRLKANGDKLFYIKDHLGSTRVVVNESGTVVESHDYFPFGLQMPGRSFLSNGLTKELFTGKELDGETGWHNLGARPYDAIIGRFPSVDRLADNWLSWSPYNYTLNNPMNLVDPTGLQPEDPEDDNKILRIDFSTIHMTISEFLDYVNEELAKGAQAIEDIISAIPGGKVVTTIAEALAADATGQDVDVAGLVKGYGEGVSDVVLGGVLGKAAMTGIRSLKKTAGELIKRSDVVLKGGRSGQLVKSLTGPPNSVVKGNQGRIFITDVKGKVIWDITKDRAKSVIPGHGFGSKQEPTKEMLNLLKQVWSIR